MSKLLRFLLLVIVLISFVIVMAKKNHNRIVAFEASGIVTEIEWQSRNHGMPIITIKEDKKLVHFQSNRITLTPNNIKVGDRFVKVSHSKICEINEVEILCLN